MKSPHQKRLCLQDGQTFYIVIAISKDHFLAFQEDIGIETDEEYGAVIPST